MICPSDTVHVLWTFGSSTSGWFQTLRLLAQHYRREFQILAQSRITIYHQKYIFSLAFLVFLLCLRMHLPYCKALKIVFHLFVLTEQIKRSVTSWGRRSLRFAAFRLINLRILHDAFWYKNFLKKSAELLLRFQRLFRCLKQIAHEKTNSKTLTWCLYC